MSLAVWILGGIILVILLILAIFVGIYNGLITKRNRVQEAWAQIDVQLKRRYDLIPNLVNTVKGYMKYEKSVLTDVTRLRSSIVSGNPDEKLQANDQLTKAFKSIFAVAENYPDLKASANFQDLQEQIETTENKIAFVRTSYNDYVLDYNNALQTFPSNMVANSFNFKPTDYFKAPDEERANVNVNFDDVNSPPSASTDDDAVPASSSKAASTKKKRGSGASDNQS